MLLRHSSSRFILLHMFWTSSFNASLGLFALALVINPLGTFNGSLAWLTLVLGWSSSTRSDANLVITWSLNPHTKTPIPGKPSKSGLIGVWHKDNLYLGTNTIGNEKPHPTNIDSWMRSIRMTPWSQLFFDKLFFSSLENQRIKIIPPTHNKCGKQEVLLIWIV